jgi:hypothetical protein
MRFQIMTTKTNMVPGHFINVAFCQPKQKKFFGVLPEAVFLVVCDPSMNEL